ncbi:MAG: DNA-binding protein WhiA [Clostridiales bacterium]|nr:DNA-binding protein WhiA [Clostridiales bacterium]
MSFSAAMKDDLARLTSHKDCCRLAEFAALTRFLGSIRIGGGQKTSLLLATEHPAVARKIFSLAKELFRMETEITVHRKDRLRKNQVFSLCMPAQEPLEKALFALGFAREDEPQRIDFSARPPRQFLDSPCCRRTYLRGAFLAAGSVNAPEGAYHMELICHGKEQAFFLRELLQAFEIGAHIFRRKQAWVVYLKGSEHIATFLTVVGSHRALLEFENARVSKDMRNYLNRRVNSEAANIGKQVEAAQKQLRDIGVIDAGGRFAKLPRILREAAEARLENPECSLAELAQILGVGKSGVNHRFRRLAEIAEQINSGNHGVF